MHFIKSNKYVSNQQNVISLGRSDSSLCKFKFVSILLLSSKFNRPISFSLCLFSHSCPCPLLLFFQSSDLLDQLFWSCCALKLKGILIKGLIILLWIRSRLSFWSPTTTTILRNESVGTAEQLTNHLIYSHIHTHQETWMGCVCYFSPPPNLPALLIRQVTTVKVLAMGQQRHSLASGTWNSNSDSPLLSPSNALITTHPPEEQEYHVMLRKEAE